MNLDDTPQGNQDGTVVPAGEEVGQGEALPAAADPTPSSSDPLDGIVDAAELKAFAIGFGTSLGRDVTAEIAGVTDPEKLRGVVKKYRSIAQRQTKKSDEPATAAPAAAPAAKPAPTDAFTKTEWYRANSKKASDIARREPAIADNWDEVRALYVNRRGQDDPDAIVEDIKDAYAVFLSRKPDAKGNPAAGLQTTSGTRVSGKPGATGARTTQPVIPRKQQITDWFPKKQ